MTDEAPMSPATQKPARLAPLTPGFLQAEHGLYIQRITDLLDDDRSTAVRNIALTGSYGSGKSSVLDALVVRPEYRKYRAARISLSTINPAKLPDSKSGQDARAISNVIQKEIVKQILYREPATTMSGSRFRRIQRFSWTRASATAVAVTTLLAFVAYFGGAADRFEAFAHNNALGLWLTNVSAFLVVTGALLVLQRALHGRIRIKGLTAGPAQIEVAADESAFDRYLDEIVYFFAVSRCTVAIFEDLDRFRRIEIYEELRALNVLLNNARQLDPIRFIYAMRDSLFEDIAETADEVAVQGAGSDNSASQAALSRLVASAANRAKFFDVVVPMVPFATLRTAVDLWREEMPAETKVSVEALQLASRYVQDMRLIRNVANEFHVFTEEIAKNDLGVEPEAVFALMLHKNVHLEDFEQIRSGDSSLDAIEQLRQEAITSTLLEWEQEEATASSAERQRLRLAAFAQSGARTITEQIERAFRAVGRTQPPVTFRAGGAEFSAAQAATVEFWQALASANWGLEILQQAQGAQPARVTELSLDDLRAWLPRDPDELEWSAQPAEVAIHSREEHDRLARAEISDLLDDDTLLSPERSAELLRQVSEESVSDLAFELVRAGLIDQNFSLNVSRFYGRVVSATAMNFVLHVVRRGGFAPFAELLGEKDVESVLGLVGERFLSTPSAFNIAVFDALADDPRLDASLELVDTDDRGMAFLQSYMTEGLHAGRIAERLAGVWPGTLAFVTSPDIASGPRGPELLSNALLGLSRDVEYLPASELPSALLARVSEVTVLLSDLDSETAETIAEVLGDQGVEFPHLDALGASARTAIGAAGLFAVTKDNLRLALGEETQWSLDVIPSPPILARLLKDLDGYLSLLPRSVPTLTTQSTLPTLTRQVVAESGEEGLRRVLRRAPSNLRALDLTTYSDSTWPVLAAEARISLTPSNFLAYAREFGVDPSTRKAIGSMRAPFPEPDIDQASRRELALMVAATDGIAVTKRVRYVRSLDLEPPLAPEELKGIGGEIVAYLVAAKLIPDTIDTFTALRTEPVSERLALVRKSRGFAGYVPGLALSDTEVQVLFRSKSITPRTKNAVLRAVSTSLPDPLSRAASNAIGNYLLTFSGKVPSPTLDRLAAGGCEPSLYLRLLVRFNVKTPRLNLLLGFLPKPWSQLSGRSVRKPLIPKSDAARVVIDRLIEGRVVATDHSEGNGYRVHVRKVV